MASEGQGRGGTRCHQWREHGQHPQWVAFRTAAMIAKSQVGESVASFRACGMRRSVLYLFRIDCPVQQLLGSFPISVNGLLEVRS